MNDVPSRGHVAVIGGGISGLAAAYFAAAGGARVTVLDGAPVVGGKLRVSEVGGVPVDEGAEAMLARRPEGLELVGRLGLTEDVVHPAPASAAIWSRGALRPLPAGQVMGVPADLAALARTDLLSPGGLLRVPLDLVLPATPGGGGAATDVSVSGYVGGRLGGELVDRLVEPLLGGVYAGRVEDLSFAATLPMLARAMRTHRSLIAAARSVRGAGADRPGPLPGPLFATLRGGLGALPGALASHIARLGGTVRAATTVREARRAATGWRLTLGSAHAPEHLDADAVIVAVPARPAARLLASEAPAAATELAAIDYASMAIVTLAYAGAPAAARPDRSGYLVPAVEERAVKAVTFSSAKWPHLDASGGPGGSGRPGAPGEVTVVRCSIGRYGEEHVLQRDDTELVDLATAELAATHGLTVRPVDTRVTRWGGGLPQYTVGHLGRVDRIRAAVARVPGLAVCGAAYDGLGIPACVATAKTAAGRALDHLGRTVPATRTQAGARGRTG